jgi:hypothetical protein
MTGMKEASQLHWRETFIPKQYLQLTDDEKNKVLESHMFVVKKHTRETKARLVGGGKKQQDYLTKEDSSSPTVATESVLLTSIVDIDEIIKVWTKACKEFDNGFKFVANCKRIATAAPEDLFKVDKDALKLSLLEAKSFHSMIMMMLYVTKQARPDTAIAVAFLTTRVREPDVDDWQKLKHLIEYLKSTHDLPLVLGALNTGVLHWHVDASFATHPDMRDHTKEVLTMGTEEEQ